MRSGVQILADHPKLYWNDDTTPGSEWIKFGKEGMPQDSLWTQWTGRNTSIPLSPSPEVITIFEPRRRTTAPLPK